MKKIVGIIANTLGFNSTNPFDDKYFAQNQYVEAVLKNGGIPIIIPAVNLKLNYDALKICDAFIITGGKKYHKYHFLAVDYALKSGKKLLGICMGMQIIGMYFNNDYDEKSLKYIDGHYFDQITHHNKELLIHDVNFDKGSILYSLFGSYLKVNSIHKQVLKYVCFPLKISGKYNDVIETVEYKNILGVQFHPELMKEGNKLFKWLLI